jgi:hypothetical protein
MSSIFESIIGFSFFTSLSINKEASEVKAAFMAELSKILTDAQKEKMPKKAEPKKKKAE